MQESNQDIRQSNEGQSQTLLEPKVPEPGEGVVNLFVRIPVALADRLRTYLYEHPGNTQRAVVIAALESYLSAGELPSVRAALNGRKDTKGE